MANLYEINAELNNLIVNSIDEDGCIDEALADKFEQLAIAKAEKIENIGLYIKNLTAETEAIRKEVDNFKRRMDSNRKKIDWLKSYLITNTDGKKLITNRVVISFRKSEAVEVYDDFLVPEMYMTESITKKPDKKAIKEAIKEGQSIAGARVIQNVSVLVK